MIEVVAASPALDVTYVVPGFRTDGIHRPESVFHLAGGKGINLARAAVALGGVARVVASLGGPIGTRVAEGARAEGIGLVALPSPEETRLCVSVVSDHGIAEVYEAAPPTSLETLLAAVGSAERVVLSGSVPDPVSALLALEGRELAVDVHGAALELLVGLRASVVKVNRLEAAELVGRAAPSLDLAQSIRDRTGGTVVVTDGTEGAVAADASGAWVAEPDPEPGRFSVGSGDSFFAGLLVALDAGEPLPVALAAASAAGSANTRCPGAGRFTLEDVAAARGRITVRPA